MIDLNKEPKAAHAILNNDLVFVDGKEFIVTQTNIVKDGIYLSKNTRERIYYLSMNDNSFLNYKDHCIHVRDTSPDNFVVFDRYELEKRLESGDYTIG